jgi:hypothetical protein
MPHYFEEELYAIVMLIDVNGKNLINNIKRWKKV